MQAKPTGYDFIGDKLAEVRAGFEAESDSGKAQMFYRAYLFSMISSSTRVRNHELGFSRVISRFPLQALVNERDTYEIAELLRSATVMYHGQKAINIVKAVQKIPGMIKMFHLSDHELRELIATQLPGVARAKASFLLMLLGRTGVCCYDTHFQKMTGANPGKSMAKYAQAEALLKLRDLEPGVYQWSAWCEYMKIPIETSHKIYFDSITQV